MAALPEFGPVFVSYILPRDLTCLTPAVARCRMTLIHLVFRFFKELEERHQQNIVIDDISDIVCKHAQSNFDPYITYCSNEVYQQRTLQRLV